MVQDEALDDVGDRHRAAARVLPAGLPTLGRDAPQGRGGPAGEGEGSPEPYKRDVNHDNSISPIDALLVINYEYSSVHGVLLYTVMRPLAMRTSPI